MRRIRRFSLRRLGACGPSTSPSTRTRSPGEASALAARIERLRAHLHQAAIERAARSALDDATVSELEELGLLAPVDVAGIRAEIGRLSSSLAALERLQAWVEERLVAAQTGVEEHELVG